MLSSASADHRPGEKSPLSCSGGDSDGNAAACGGSDGKTSEAAYEKEIDFKLTDKKSIGSKCYT